MRIPIAAVRTEAERAGRLAECEIDQIVHSEKLVISKQKTPGAVRAVGTLMKVFKRDGRDSLRRALSLARDAFVLFIKLNGRMLARHGRAWLRCGRARFGRVRGQWPMAH